MNRFVRHAGLLLLILPALAFGQSGSGTLQARPGERGLWVPQNAGDERLVNLDSANPGVVNPFGIEANPLMRTPRVAGAAAPDLSFRKLTMSEVPFQPWAKALRDSTVELFEFVCQDNNLAPELMLGASQSMDRSRVSRDG